MHRSTTIMAQVTRTRHHRTPHPKESNTLATRSTAMMDTMVSRAALNFSSHKAHTSRNVEVTTFMGRHRAHRQEREGMETMVSSDKGSNWKVDETTGCNAYHLIWELWSRWWNSQYWRSQLGQSFYRSVTDEPHLSDDELGENYIGFRAWMLLLLL